MEFHRAFEVLSSRAILIALPFETARNAEKGIFIYIEM